MATLAEQVARRYASMLTARRQWKTEWQALAKYVLPRRAVVLQSVTPGSKLTTGLFDGTAIKANEDLASALHDAMTSIVLRWHLLKMRDERLNRNGQVAKALDRAADKLYLARQQSNFNAAIREFYLDEGAFGIGALICEERTVERPGFNGFRYRHIGVGEYVIEEDADERVDTLIRKFSLTATAAAAKWGAEKLSDRTRQKMERDPETRIAILHAIWPREGGKSEKDTPATALRWASIYVEAGEPSSQSEILGQPVLLEEGGYHEFPAMVARWAKGGEEVYGRGPGHTALPDILTLNRAVELKLKQWAKEIDPPMQKLHGGVAGKVSLTPAAINDVYEKDAISPIRVGANFDVQAMNEADYRQKIQSAFYADLIKLPPPQTSPVSATEISARWQEWQRRLAPILSRLYVELLAPLIDREFALMLRAGEFRDLEVALASAGAQPGVEIDVEYQGPLQRAQKAGDLSAVQTTYAIAMPLAQAEPEVLDVLDGDAAIRYIADVAGAPREMIRDDRAVKTIRAARAQAMQQKQALEDAATVADAAKRGAGAAEALSRATTNGKQAA